MHCALYNAAIANRQTQYKRFGHSVDYFEQQNSLPVFKEVWPEYKELGSQTLQATLKRKDRAKAQRRQGTQWGSCTAEPPVLQPFAGFASLRVDFGYQRFFKGLAKYPRFKAKRRYRGWIYPSSATGWKVQDEYGSKWVPRIERFKAVNSYAWSC